ncbi:hypothetical protein ACC695_40005, partial [Rhizobium ruizarguesonis]
PFGIYAVLTGFILGLAFPLSANAETAVRRNGDVLSAAEVTALRNAIERQFIVDSLLKYIGSVYITIHIRVAYDLSVSSKP